MNVQRPLLTDLGAASPALFLEQDQQLGALPKYDYSTMSLRL
jgi:hypothetical protein